MNYSINEKSLLAHFGINVEKHDTSAWYSLYTSAVVTAFLRPYSFSPEAMDALRRAYKHLCFEGKYRDTPEFEALLEW